MSSNSKYCQCQECKKDFILTKLTINSTILFCPFCKSRNIARISFNDYLIQMNRRFQSENLSKLQR